MSKGSYARGFCKEAEAQGVDPSRLAEYIQKKATVNDELQNVWKSVKDYLDKAKAWYDIQDEGTKSLIGTGVGALGIGALNKLLGGKFSNGAILGGIGGLAASGINWKEILKQDKPDGETN